CAGKLGRARHRDPPPDALLAEELGPGEAEAIALGVRRRADLLLIDERKGRRIATLAYNLHVKWRSARSAGGDPREREERIAVAIHAPGAEARDARDRLEEAALRARGHVRARLRGRYRFRARCHS